MPRRKRATAEPQQNEFTTKSKRPRLPTATSATRTQEPAITPAPIKTRASRSKSLNSPFNHKQCLSWFREYANETGETVEPEGMEKFCEDLGVEPENVVMLSIAYTLQAQQMGFFTESEWMMGMTALQCDSTVKLQNKLDHLKGILKDPVQFKNIFRYAFDFARDKDQRSMEIGTAKEMLGLLLGKQWSLFSSFNQYLEQSKFRVINKDQWQNVLEFSRLIRTDLSNYDEDGAWPVMLDEFVEWYREQGHGAASTSSTTTSPSSSHVPMS